MPAETREGPESGKGKKILLLNPVHQLHCIWVIELPQLRQLIHHSWPELKSKTKQNKNKIHPHPRRPLRWEGRGTAARRGSWASGRGTRGSVPRARPSVLCVSRPLRGFQNQLEPKLILTRGVVHSSKPAFLFLNNNAAARTQGNANLERGAVTVTKGTAHQEAVTTILHPPPTGGCSAGGSSVGAAGALRGAGSGEGPHRRQGDRPRKAHRHLCCPLCCPREAQTSAPTGPGLAGPRRGRAAPQNLPPNPAPFCYVGWG